MSPLSVVTSRSTLMHAALAYLSQEICTFDTLIESRATLSHQTHASHFLQLPLELLYVIRSHLIVAITAQLMDRSATALKRYESTLRILLCPECIQYNQDVYGKDVWSWEQFSGACGCLQRGWRIKDTSVTQPLLVTINPKQFTDRTHWLEYYLSRKSLRFLRGRAMVHSSRSPEIIWDAVSAVLDDFNCKLIRARERQRRLLRREVMVVPHHAYDETPCVDHEWNNEVALNRVDRDLGLSLCHSNAIEDMSLPSHPSSHRSSHSQPTLRKDSYRACYELALIQPTLQSLKSVLSTLLAIPVACTTLFLTIICFYTRPGAFRVM